MMGQKLSFLFLVASTLFIAQCGKWRGDLTGPVVSPTPTPESSNKKIYLTLFAGYPCKSCNKELPDIRDQLKSLFGDKQAFIQTRVFVVGGPGWSAATPENAKAYGEKLNIPFQMLVDDHCKNEYKKYYPENESCLVPAALIQSSDENVLDKFPAGKLTIDQLMTRLKERVETLRSTL